MSKEHELKIWPVFFEKVIDGSKTFEFRKNDRDYQEGDVLMLKEWSQETGYTGRWCTAEVGMTFNIFNGVAPIKVQPDQEKDLMVLSLKEVYYLGERVR